MSCLYIHINYWSRQLSLLQKSAMFDAKDFYDYLVNKMKIKFIPRFSNQEVNRIFELTLNKKMSYDQV
jgi:ubiquitin carboxyl-terminal hydrolase 7